MSEQSVSLGETQLGVDRIATSPTAYAFYDNVPAMARGAPGAPRISPWATIPEGTVAVGSTVRYADLQTPAGWDRQSTVQAAAVQVWCTGTLTVSFRQYWEVLAGSPGNIQANIRRLRGTSETIIATWNRSSTDPATRSADVAVLPGDSIMIAHRGRDNNPGQQAISLIDQFRISVSAGSPQFWIVGPGSVVLPAAPT